MLLKSQERQICEQIAAGQPPYSQRAMSLLAIDAGVTQTAAALQSGLTLGQVKYWLGKFRKSRMGIFPEERITLSAAVPFPAQDVPDLPAVPEASDLDQPVKQDILGEESKDAAAIAGADVEPGKKGRAKTKKKPKKSKAPKKSKKKKKNKNGKKRKATREKKRKKKQEKMMPPAKKTAKKKKAKK